MGNSYTSSPFAVSDKIATASKGPTEQSAMSPKLFSPACRPPIVVAIPTPSAIIKGTVMGPVVTPPESKSSAKNLLFPVDKRIADRAKIMR